MDTNFDDQMDYGGAPPPSTSLPTPTSALSTTSIPAPAPPPTPTLAATPPQDPVRPPSMQSRSAFGGGNFDLQKAMQHPMVQGLFKQLGFSPEMLKGLFPGSGGAAAVAPTPGATGASEGSAPPPAGAPAAAPGGGMPGGLMSMMPKTGGLLSMMGNTGGLMSAANGQQPGGLARALGIGV